MKITTNGWKGCQIAVYWSHPRLGTWLLSRKWRRQTARFRAQGDWHDSFARNFHFLTELPGELLKQILQIHCCFSCQNVLGEFSSCTRIETFSRNENKDKNRERPQNLVVSTRSLDRDWQTLIPHKKVRFSARSLCDMYKNMFIRQLKCGWVRGLNEKKPWKLSLGAFPHWFCFEMNQLMWCM